MQYTSELDSTNGICVVHVIGELCRTEDCDELKQFAIDSFNKHGCRRFLFDTTEADVITRTLLTFASASPEEKIALETKKETLALDIERCRQDMLDADTIAKTLTNFDDMVSALSLEDQKDLFTLLLKEVTVWSFDPQKEKAPAKNARAFISKIRTKWYKIRLDLYQFPEISTYYKKISGNPASSDFTKKWLPREDSAPTLSRSSSSGRPPVDFQAVNPDSRLFPPIRSASPPFSSSLTGNLKTRSLTPKG